MKLRNPSVYSNFKEWTAGFRVCMLVQPSLASPRLLIPASSFASYIHCYSRLLIAAVFSMIEKIAALCKAAIQ